MAVALEWALLEIARRDNRPFYSIPFSGRGQFDVWYAGEDDAQSLAEHLAHFYNGGTELYEPLTQACEVVRMVNDDLQRADILVITDGLFGEPSEGFLEILTGLRQTDPVKIALVSVGAENPAAQAFADPIIHVDDLLKNARSCTARLRRSCEGDEVRSNRYVADQPQLSFYAGRAWLQEERRGGGPRGRAVDAEPLVKRDAGHQPAPSGGAVAVFWSARWLPLEEVPLTPGLLLRYRLAQEILTVTDEQFRAIATEWLLQQQQSQLHALMSPTGAAPANGAVTAKEETTPCSTGR